MFHIFGIAFFFIIILFIVGLMIILRFINATSSFLGSLFNPSGKRNSRQSANSEYRNTTQSTSEPTQKSDKKVFGDDEGEYIEFEEIKEP